LSGKSLNASTLLGISRESPSTSRQLQSASRNLAASGDPSPAHVNTSSSSQRAPDSMKTDVTAVTTTQGFYNALGTPGTKHIEVQNHLDLSTSETYFSFDVHSDVMTIRV
jgi:hypothetical protein